jgi:hypothetical protein
VSYLRWFESEPTLPVLASTAAVALSATVLALLSWPETRRELRQMLGLRAAFS